VSVRPVAFLVVHNGSVRLLPVDQRASIERLIELAPEMVDKIIAAVGGRADLRRAAPGGNGTAAEPRPEVSVPAETGIPR
jgi:uncharacterized spore protein YtfJ